jgi:hypothetical protein
MKKMSIWMRILWAAALVAGACLVSCEGLSVSLGSDGKFSVSGMVPAPKGKVVEGKGSK